MSRSRFLIMIFVLLAGSRAVAAPQPDAARIAQAGNGHGAAPCSVCHGAHGDGNPATGYPRLAGLNRAYLLKQLDDFANGTRRSPIMQPNAKALSPAQRKAMAVYYSAMPVPTLARQQPALSASDAERGRQLALRGRWSRKLPACETCHGPGGVGVGAHFPPLAGQPAQYIASQLRAWQTGTRRNDPLQLMQHVSSALSAADIRAVSAWFAAQPLHTGGQSR